MDGNKQSKLFNSSISIILCLACIFWLIAITLWIHFSFGSPTFDSIIYHISPESLLTGDMMFVVSFCLGCILFPLALIFLVDRTLLKRFHEIKQFRYGLFVILIISFSVFVKKIKVYPFLKTLSQEDKLAKLYTPPVFKSDISKRNLVIIYAESMEDTYSDNKLFGKNLLSPLDKYFKESVRFKNLVQLPGSGWTIAGMVSSQCGIPLKIPLFIPGHAKQGNRIGEHFESYLPRAKCLGDVLAKDGYYQVYMGGAKLSFGGKGRFYKTHGYDEVLGFKHWINKYGKGIPKHRWGVADDFLFKQAKQKFRELTAKGKPFNLTLLTVDTHHPSGLENPTCKKLGYRGLDGIIHCSAYLISDFINYISQSEIADNISIISITMFVY